jgi:hypothetical protein
MNDTVHLLLTVRMLLSNIYYIRTMVAFSRRADRTAGSVPATLCAATQRQGVAAPRPTLIFRQLYYSTPVHYGRGRYVRRFTIIPVHVYYGQLL